MPGRSGAGGGSTLRGGGRVRRSPKSGGGRGAARRSWQPVPGSTGPAAAGRQRHGPGIPCPTCAERAEPGAEAGGAGGSRRSGFRGAGGGDAALNTEYLGGVSHNNGLFFFFFSQGILIFVRVFSRGSCSQLSLNIMCF